MQRRDTASSFLLREGRILLLHRSPRCRSYPDRWSVVSGSVEEGEAPWNAALREIEEETGYQPEQLHTLAAGHPFEVEEAGRPIVWRVHPFLWWLTDPAEPKLNWESQDHAWVLPDALDRSDTVPELAAALAAMLPLPATGTRTLAQALATDTRSGARELTLALARELPSLLQKALTWPGLLSEAYVLARARPAMAPLGGFVNRWLEGLHPRADVEPGPWAAPLELDRRQALVDRHGELIERLRRAAGRIAERVAPRLAAARRIVVLSSSSTLVAALETVDPAPLGPEIVCAQSLPGGEGRLVRQVLAERNLRVRLVADAALFGELAGADLLLLGADAVFPDGSIANKIGSAAAAASARYHGVEVIVLADRFKALPRNEDFEPEPATVDAGVDACPLFERVDADLIDRVVTEDGDWHFHRGDAAASLP